MQHYYKIYKTRNGCEHVTCVNYTKNYVANDKKCNE
jgi:hypothetical protein